MKTQHIHMVGIGGIGMSALAQLFLAQGAEISGCDRGESPTTELLRAKGISVSVGHEEAHITSETTLLIYSDAIPADNPERVKAREQGIEELSYFAALGRAAEGKRVIAVAGTHGKTTTTAMIGKMLIDAGEDPTVVVGSIVTDFKSNYREGKSDIFVVEACEYRRHFLNFHPKVLVITNIELDHTDYFRDLADVESAFAESVATVEDGGVVIADPTSASVIAAIAKATAPVVDYVQESVPTLKLPGEFNRENARAAKAAVRALVPGIVEEVLDQSLESFHGTWRRFEYKGQLPHDAMLYDDYAHQPTAIRRTILAAKEKFPDKRIAVVFHPHLYSRTRDLFDDFAASLALVDEAYVLPIYAAREEPDPAVSHESLAEAVNQVGGHAQALADLDEATRVLAALPKDVVAFTMGAGDVYRAGEAALLLSIETATQ